MKWYNVDWWKWAIAVPVLILILSMFCRCKSKQPIVTQQTYITDKQNEKEWDSLFNMRLTKELERFQSSRSEKIEKTLKDVTHIKDSTASRFDSNGKKIGEDKFYSEIRVISEKDVHELRDSIEHYKKYVDSTMLYSSKCDSLNKVINNISKNKEYVEKRLSKWQSICLETGQMFYVFIFLILLVFIYNKVKKSS